MSFNVKKHKGELLFVPLGGAGEIGMNFNLYHLDGKWLICDFGIGFAEDFMPGIDMIVPDIDYIAAQKEKVIGIILTHAHEDHLGAVPYLWDVIGAPIYTTPFTAAFLRAKLTESPFGKEVPIHEVAPETCLNLDPFTVEFLQLTHSAPEMNALIVGSRFGKVLHTGDWKFDPDPVIGPTSDKEKLKKLGDEGVLALVGDSTNVFSQGHSGSEGDLRESLVNLVAACDQMVAITTFASNVARIASVAYAAKKANRKVVLAGRSLWRVVEAAKSVGYLADYEFITDEMAVKLPRNKQLILSTGCQGEPLAATAKLANNAHRFLRLLPGDTIIFSSKIIPGNDKRIFRLFNKFSHNGVEVLTERDHFVHVSGHPNRDEVQEMYNLVRPEVSIPVHGETVHMHEHARMAKEWGAKSSLQIGNGDVVRLAPGNTEIIGNVPVGFLGLDGNYLQPPDSQVMRARRRLRREGIVFVSITLRKDGKLACDPVVAAPGCLDSEEDYAFIEELQKEIRHIVHGQGRNRSKKGKTSSSHLEQSLRSAVKKLVTAQVGKQPMIDLHMAEIT